MPLISEPEPREPCTHVVYCCYGADHEPVVVHPEVEGMIAICDRCDRWVFAKFWDGYYMDGYRWAQPNPIRFLWWKMRGKHEGKVQCMPETVPTAE